MSEIAPGLTANHQNSLSGTGGTLFPRTQWSMISVACHEEESEAREALGRMARAYWKPLYVFVRQRNLNHEDASDAVQGFFAHLMSKDLLHGLEQRETKFRSFLLRCFQNWLVSQHRKAVSGRRGGGILHMDLDAANLETALAVDAHQSPEEAFDRRWARTIFDQARAALNEEIGGGARSKYLQAIERKIFQPGMDGPNWSEIALEFGHTDGAVRKTAFDLRRRFAVLLRAEVSAGVSQDEEVDAELRYLFQLLSKSGGCA